MTMKKPKSDLFTVLVHWGLMIGLCVSLVTGLRIASDMPQSMLAQTLTGILPQGNVIYWHLVSALGFVGLSAAYVVFIWRAGLAGRIMPNATWRSDLLRPSDARARWRALNVLVYWLAFAALVIALLTGLVMDVWPALIPYALAGAIHQYAAWALPVYVVLHVIALSIMGGVAYLLKILRPRPAFGAAAALSLVAGTAAAALLYTAERNASQSMIVTQTDRPPELDGDPDDPVWQQAAPVTVETQRGANADNGSTRVTLRAVHDDESIYLLVQWSDDTRSQKHLPLVRTEQGWRVQQTEFGIQDEDSYYEDKFGIMLARKGRIAGDHSIHLGQNPLADKPGPSGGRGLHYTTDGSIVDVWHWKSVRTGNSVMNQIDDNFFGPPMEPKGEGRYTGGYSKDPKTGGGYAMNWESYSDDLVTPAYLPKDPSSLARFQTLDLAPEVSDDVSLFLRQSDVVEYDKALDTLENFPVGTIMPAVVVDKAIGGDRGDVTAVSNWENGIWTMEIKRDLNTGSKYDVAFLSGVPTYLWVSAFDHAQTRHTRHLYPVIVELQ